MFSRLSRPASRLYLMRSNPVQNIFILEYAGCNAQSQMNHILITAFHADSIDLQESQHGIHADSLVPVNESMIGD